MREIISNYFGYIFGFQGMHGNLFPSTKYMGGVLEHRYILSSNCTYCCAVELSSILTHLNNESLSTGIFPDLLKVAKVVPIFKNGDKKTDFKL